MLYRSPRFVLLIFLLAVLLAWPALAQQDRYDLQDETVSPKAQRLLEKGEELQKRGRLNDALQAYEQASRQQPEWPQPYFNLGLLQAQQQRLAEAAEAFQQAVCLRPQWAKEIGRAHV